MHRLRRASQAEVRRLLRLLLIWIGAVSAHSGRRGPDVPAELTGEIRPGICRPDWSVVTKPAARAALMGRHDARSGLSQKWSRALLPGEDLVWRTTVELFAGGRSPLSVWELAEAVGLSGEQ